MKSVQTRVIERLEHDLGKKFDVIEATDWANTGKLVLMRQNTLRVAGTIRYDFQTSNCTLTAMKAGAREPAIGALVESPDILRCYMDYQDPEALSNGIHEIVQLCRSWG